MNKPISLVMAYYDNPGMLQEHYRHIRSLPASIRDFLFLVIVDDGSPNHPAVPPVDLGVPFQIFRIHNDIRWNQDGARNIGVAHSECEWVLMTDMDHLVPEETWRGLMTMDAELDMLKVYTFQRQHRLPEAEGGGVAPYKSHPNSWLMTKRVFESIGGYDERYAGIYGSDGDFRNRLREVATLEELPLPLLLYPRSVMPDASTTTYERKTKADEEGKRRVKHERAAEGGKDGKAWRTKRFLQPYERVAKG